MASAGTTIHADYEAFARSTYGDIEEVCYAALYYEHRAHARGERRRPPPEEWESEDEQAALDGACWLGGQGSEWRARHLPMLEAEVTVEDGAVPRSTKILYHTARERGGSRALAMRARDWLETQPPILAGTITIRIREPGSGELLVVRDWSVEIGTLAIPSDPDIRETLASLRRTIRDLRRMHHLQTRASAKKDWEMNRVFRATSRVILASAGGIKASAGLRDVAEHVTQGRPITEDLIVRFFQAANQFLGAKGSGARGAPAADPQPAETSTAAGNSEPAPGASLENADPAPAGPEPEEECDLEERGSAEDQTGQGEGEEEVRLDVQAFIGRIFSDEDIDLEIIEDEPDIGPDGEPLPKPPSAFAVRPKDHAPGAARKPEEADEEWEPCSADLPDTQEHEDDQGLTSEALYCAIWDDDPPVWAQQRSPPRRKRDQPRRRRLRSRR